MGVIGSMISSRFVQEGHRPVIMARHLDRSLIRPIEDHVDIELGDVLDLPRILSIIQSYKITHIIHTAALLSFAKVMEHYQFYYIPLTFILSPDYGGEDKGEGV